MYSNIIQVNGLMFSLNRKGQVVGMTDYSVYKLPQSGPWFCDTQIVNGRTVEIWAR